MHKLIELDISENLIVLKNLNTFIEKAFQLRIKWFSYKLDSHYMI